MLTRLNVYEQLHSLYHTFPSAGELEGHRKVDLLAPTCSQACNKHLLVAIPDVNRNLHLPWDSLPNFSQISNTVAYFKQSA